VFLPTDRPDRMVHLIMATWLECSAPAALDARRISHQRVMPMQHQPRHQKHRWLKASWREKQRHQYQAAYIDGPSV